MKFRVFVLTAFAAIFVVSPSFAAVPQYVEGEAIVMMRMEVQSAARNITAARSLANGVAADAASELGAEVVQNFLPVGVEGAGADNRDGAVSAGAARAISANVGESEAGGAYAIAHLRSAGGESTEEFIARLRENPRVVSAMPNYIMRLSSTPRSEPAEAEDTEAAVPDDPLYGEQWGLARIGLPKVWARAEESESEEVVVAVIDTGILYDHEDLSGNMYKFDRTTLERMDASGIDAGEFAGSHGAWFHSSVDFEDDGETPITAMLAPVPVGPGTGITQHASIGDILTITDKSRYVADVDGHGTHVAGIIGAVTDNSIGVAGTARNVKLMAVNVFSAFEDDGDYATGSLTSDQLRAIDFIIAAKNAGVNIRVANMSLGNWDDAADDTENALYSAKIKALSDAGVIVCMAAGNEDQDMDAPDGEYAGQINVPAMFRFENTITVGASGEEDERSEEACSNYSSSGKWVDVFAPGGHILSTCRYEPITGEDNTWSGDGYTSISGTSMATPYVAGVAALLCSVFPERGAAEIKQMILDGADGSVLREGYSKYGRLDAYGAWKVGMGVVSEVEPAEPGQIPVSDGAVAVMAEFAASEDDLPDSLKNCVKAVDGSFYLDYAIAHNAVESMDGARNVERLSLFPVFTAHGGGDSALGSGVVAAFAFTVPGEIFGDGCGFGDVAVCKVKPDGTCLGYSRDEDGVAAEGEFQIYNDDWSDFGGIFDGGAKYNIVLYIADDGPYDLDGAAGAIADPTAIVRYGAEKQAVSGGGGGGCSAGFGAAVLFAVPMLGLFGLALKKCGKRGS